jgi:hypothetical protein
LPAAAYQKLLEVAASKRGTDAEIVTAGAAQPGAAVIKVATTDYLARVSAGYREIFAGVPLVSTGKRVRQLVRDRIASGARAP